MITADKLKLYVKEKAHKNNLQPQDIMQMYFFERLLYRISISKYKYNFILKGGLLLSAIIGDNRRTTQDMDTMIKGIDLDNETLIPIINEIINIDTEDGISFKIVKTKDIREIDVYGGIKVYLLAKKEHLQVPLSIDITTKDPITPRELSFKYRCLFEDNYISIMAFSIETIIAEKFETLIKDVNSNTRAKDFYDLYILIHNHYDELNEHNLLKAIRNTCKRRESLHILDELEERYDEIKDSEILQLRWEIYKSKYPYAKKISYDEILGELDKIVKLLQREYQIV